MTLKQKWQSWKRDFTKKFILWYETRRRGGIEARDSKRRDRQSEIYHAKESIYSDLESGWMLGEFRMRGDHVEKLKGGWKLMTVSQLEEIYRYYRTWQNETLNPW